MEVQPAAAPLHEGGWRNCALLVLGLGIKRHSSFCFYLFFKKNKDFIYLSLERGEGREKQGEKHQCVVASLAHPPLGTWPTT